MSSSDFQRLEELFHRALDADPAEREVLLSAVREDDPALHQRLERLLARAHDDGDETLIRSSLGRLKQQLDSAGLVDFGPYRIVRLIGSGGMGVVFEAQQEQPIARRVAIKVVPNGRDSERVLARFDLERQALARMNHPSIASVFDAGQTEDGRPYFVMEFVDGAPITQYCDRRRLSIRQRIELFGQVCRAVEHAHQKGILHRDLKPTNLLVADSTDGPIVKVIDFGIARSIESEAGPEALTRVGEHVGTPAYMSPEQAAGTAGDVDTRTDVFSLGVLLYELLTGQLPFETQVLRHGPDPHRPSTHFTAQSVPTSQAAAARGATPAQLHASLNGDLDWIALKALEVDRERRYPAVSALLEDLVRHLNDQPVSARPPTTRYRVSKFVRRHRIALVAASLVVLALVGGIVGTSLAMLRARSAQQEAQQQAQISRRVAQFMVSLFDGARPTSTAGREVTALELVEQGADRLRQELHSEPAVRAALQRSVAEVFIQLGRYDRAERELQEAIAASRQLGSEDELGLATGLMLSGRLDRYRENPTEAQAAYEQALAIQERLLPPNDSALLGTLNELALLIRSSNPDRSISLLQRVYQARVADPATAETQDTQAVLNNIGSNYIRRRNYREGARVLEQALAIAQRTGRDQDTSLGTLYGNLALAHIHLGNFERAGQLLDQDDSIQRRSLPAEHPTHALSAINRTRLLERTGPLERALESIERADRILTKNFPPSHSLRQMTTNIRAALLIRLGQRATARELLTALLSVESKTAESRTAIDNAAITMAALERLDGRPEVGLKLLDGLLTGERATADEWTRRSARWERAYTLAAAGRRSEAETEQAAALAEPAGRWVEPGTVSVARAKLAAALGDSGRAVELLREALQQGYRGAEPVFDPTFDTARRVPGFPTFEEFLAKR